MTRSSGPAGDSSPKRTSSDAPPESVVLVTPGPSAVPGAPPGAGSRASGTGLDADSTGLAPGARAEDPWARLAQANERQEYLEAWLAIQSALVPGAIQGVLLLRPHESDPFAPVAHWARGSADPTRLAGLAEGVLDQKCGLAMELEPVEGTIQVGGTYGLGYPVKVEDVLCGAVVVEVQTSQEAALRLGMQQLQWGITGAQLPLSRDRFQADTEARQRLGVAIELLTTVLSHETFAAASMAFVTSLAEKLRCDRVSLGQVKGDRVRILAMSHSTEFGKRMKLNRSIVAVMEEAVAQRSEIRYPPPSPADTWIVRDHEALAKSHGAVGILTIPTTWMGEFAGALTLERAIEEPFTNHDVKLCSSVAALVTPILQEKRLNDRFIVTKVVESVAGLLGRILGPGHLVHKLVVILAVTLGALLRVVEVPYRLSASTYLEGSVRRALVSPFDGFIAEAKHRAGDTVKKGELVCRLDDRELRLERVKIVTQRTQLERQYQEAVAGGRDKGKASVIEAQLDQSKAQLELLQGQLERTHITAPFDGLLTSGDLSQRLGATTKQGESLFEIAPLDAYRVILKVDERRIADVKEGQGGSMILSALPSEVFGLVVEKISPVTTALEGRNFFRVEARLDRTSQRLRPGMEGVAKVNVDRRLLFHVITRDTVESIRLWFWSWIP